MTLYEISLYNNGEKVPSSSLSITLSSGPGWGSPTECIDDNVNTACHTGQDDPNIFMVVDAGQIVFDEVVAINGWHNADSAKCTVFKQGLVVSDENFISQGSFYERKIYTFAVPNPTANPKTSPTAIQTAPPIPSVALTSAPTPAPISGRHALDI